MDNRQAQGSHLPNEILLRIVHYTDKPTLKSLRYTSRVLCAYADPFFARAYFQCVRVLTTKPALEMLQEICSSPSIAPHITKVAIHTVRPSASGRQNLEALSRYLGGPRRSAWATQAAQSAQSEVKTASLALEVALSEHELLRSSIMDSVQAAFQASRCNDNLNVIWRTESEIIRPNWQWYG